MFVFLLGGIFSAKAQTMGNNGALQALINASGQVGVNISNSGGAFNNYVLKVTLPTGVTYTGGATETNNTGATITPLTERAASTASAPEFTIQTIYGNAQDPTHIIIPVNVTCAFVSQNIIYRLYQQNGTTQVGTSFSFQPITVNTPVSPVVPGATILTGTATTLHASSSITGAIYKWYSDAAGTTLLGTGPDYTTSPLSNTTDFYCKVSGSGYCEGPITKATVTTLSARADPTDMIVAGATICDNSGYVPASGVTASRGTSVVLSVKPTGTGTNGVIANPVYKWYSDAALTNLLYNGQYFTTPVLSSAITYYVTIQGTGVAPNFPGTPVQVKLGNCGGTTFVGNCPSPSTSTRVSAETFGTGSTAPIKNSPNTYVSNTALPGSTTTYVFNNAATYPPPNNHYSIAQIADGNGGAGYPNWWTNTQLRDHTGDTYGYMGVFNASTTRGTFYTKTIRGLCPGTKLYFSAWAVSLFRSKTGGIDPNLAFILTNPNSLSNDTLAILQTGDIPNGDNAWRQYAFDFNMPATGGDVTLSIINNIDGGTGDDLALDDIEIYICKPKPSITPEKTYFCNGESVNLTANFTDNGTYASGYTYQWYYNKTAAAFPSAAWTPVGTPSSIYITPNPTTYPFTTPTSTTDTGYYRVVVGNAINIANNQFACTAISDSVKVEVRAMPVVTPITGGTQNLCLGATTTFADATPGGIWSSDNTSVATVNSTGTVTSVATGNANINYAVTLNGCTSSVISPVIVNPVPSFTTANPNPICVRDAVDLSAYVSNMVNVQTLSYYSDPAGINAISSTVTPEAGTTTYYVNAVSSTGCISPFLPITVTVRPYATSSTVNISGTSVCSGSSTTLTAMAPSITNPIFKWYTDPNLTMPAPGTNVGPSYTTPNLTGATHYYVAVTGDNICPTTSSNGVITVNIDPTSTITPSIAGSLNVCGSSTVTYSTESGMTGYVWTVTGGTISGASNTSSVTVDWNSSGSGSLSIIYSGAACSSQPNSETVTINTLPIITGAATVCQNSTIQFSANPLGGTWSSSDPTIATLDPVLGIITGVKAGNTNIIAYITSEGCAASKSITVNPLPVTDPIPSQTVCNGSTTSLVTFSGSISNTNYTWVNDNAGIGLPSGGTGNISSFTAINAGATPITGNITVMPTANGCIGNNQSFAITVNPTPNLSETSVSDGTNYHIALSANQLIGQPQYSLIAVTPTGAMGTLPIIQPTNQFTLPVAITEAIFSVTDLATGCETKLEMDQVALPVKFISFNASVANGGILLNWIIASDVKNKNFVVQYSENGRNFTNVATIPYINNVTSYHYTYTEKVQAISYLRIIGIDMDNILTYTSIKKVMSSGSNKQVDLQISPNPAKDILNVQLAAQEATETHIRIFDIRGSELLRFTKRIDNNGTVKVPVNVGYLPQGIYILQANFTNEIKTIKFVKN